MKGVFVDTAGWMACADEGDPACKQACTTRDSVLEQGSLLITTDYVIDETLTLNKWRACWRCVGQKHRIECYVRAPSPQPFYEARFVKLYCGGLVVFLITKKPSLSPRSGLAGFFVGCG